MPTVTQDWPANLTDRQLAAEHARELSNRLGASVNAGMLAQNWLTRWGGYTPYAGDRVPRHHHRRRGHRHHGGSQGGASQAGTQAQSQRPAPRGYLTGAGVPAAISSVLTTLLTALWNAAGTAGWASAAAVLGGGMLDGAERALEDISRLGGKRLGWVLETRLKRLERLLMEALRDGMTVTELADGISAILGSLVSALLVTGTETSWAGGQAALRAYRAAGVKALLWETRRDGLVCGRCLANQAQGAVALGKRFKSGDLSPPAHPRCRCWIVPAPPPKPEGKPSPP